jgi:hypothetical protein
VAIIIPYVKQTWTDGVSSCSAARNNVHEDGIHDAHYQPAVHAFHNTTQSLVHATFTALALNSERYDTAGNVASTMHDNVTNNSRLTCRYAGIYLIISNVTWAVNSTGQRQVYIRLNNLTDIGRVAHAAYQDPGQCVSVLYQLAVNDYVETRGYQDSGAGLNVTAVEFSMSRVG